MRRQRILSTLSVTLFVLASGCGSEAGPDGSRGKSNTTQQSVVCQFDPDAGSPNPLGMRTLLTIVGDAEGGGGATLEQLPAMLGGEHPATVASVRILSFSTGDAESIRARLASDPSLWKELLGLYEEGAEPVSFADVDASLACAPGEAPAPIVQLGANQDPTCLVDPELGQNPLGMRTFVSANVDQDGVTFDYEQLPALVSGAEGEEVMLVVYRQLLISGVSMDEARSYLLDNGELYNELVGYEDPEGFKALNDVLSCESAQ